MKVKFLLVPASIIVALVLAIWHIWPAWFDVNMDNSIKTLRANIEKENAEISKISNKKKNISNLTSSLQSDSANRDLIFNYYPIIRREEDVINKINHIAFGSGVFLTKVDVEYEKIDEKNDSGKILAIPVEKESIQANDIEAAISKEKDSKDLGKKFISVEVGVYGDYEQIKGFITALNAIGFLNNVQSFEIKKEENKTAVNSDNVETSGLVGNIKANFGYANKKNKQVSELIDNALLNSGNFNFEKLNEKKTQMTEDYPNSETGEMGTVNPFKL